MDGRNTGLLNLSHGFKHFILAAFHLRYHGLESLVGVASFGRSTWGITFSFATTFLLAPVSLCPFGQLISLVLVKVQKFLVCVIA